MLMLIADTKHLTNGYTFFKSLKIKIANII